MSEVIKKAIIRDGIRDEVMPKTHVENVYIDDNTTLADKLIEIISMLNLKAKSEDVSINIRSAINATQDLLTDRLNTTAMSLSEDIELRAKKEVLTAAIDSLQTTLTKEIELRATIEELNEAINNLRQEILGETPVEAYNTFTEMAQYISEHADISEALTAAIGLKADQTTVEALQLEVTNAKTDHDTDIEAVQASIQSVEDGVRTLSDTVDLKATQTYVDENIQRLDTAIETLQADHDADVQAVQGSIQTLDNNIADVDARLTALKLESGSSTFYMASAEPENFGAGDLLFQVIEN